MLGYKATKKGMICEPENGYMKYNLGEVFSFDSQPIICLKGYHFCLKLIDTFVFYPDSESERYTINTLDGIVKGGGCSEPNKYVSNKIKFIKKLSKKQIEKIIFNEYDSHAHIPYIIIHGYVKLNNRFYKETIKILKDYIAEHDEIKYCGHITKAKYPSIIKLTKSCAELYPNYFVKNYSRNIVFKNFNYINFKELSYKNLYNLIKSIADELKNANYSYLHWSKAIISDKVMCLSKCDLKLYRLCKEIINYNRGG